MNKLIICLFIMVSVNTFAQRGGYQSITERNGKIGIGTRNPDQMLTVKGTIHSQEVLIDLKGAVAPDYVFEQYYDGYSGRKPDYRLFELDSLEGYLIKYKHLPGIPSADQIEQDGMALKALNLKLLEKIEELTLYTIAQQKELDKLKNELARLKDE